MKKVKDLDNSLKEKFLKDSFQRFSIEERFDEDLSELLWMSDNFSKGQANVFYEMNKPIYYENLGDFLKTIFKDNLDKLNFSDKILNYKNTDKWFQVPDIINETAKEFFNDDLDEKFLIEWIKEMFFNLWLDFLTEKLDQNKNNQEKLETTKKKITLNNESFDKELFLKQFNDKLYDIDTNRLFDELLKNKFSIQEISAFANFFFRKIYNLNNSWWLALLGHWKTAWALIHLINSVFLILTDKKLKTFQADIWDPEQFDTYIGSKFYCPNNDKLLLIDYKWDLLFFSHWILSTKLEFPITRNNNSQIVFAMPIIEKEYDDSSYYLEGDVRYIKSPFSCSNKFWSEFISQRIEIEIFDKMIEKIVKNDLSKDIFFEYPFLINWVFDPELILQDTEYLFVAANTLFKQIKEDIDLENLEKIYINYTKEKEFSLVFVLWLFLKKYYLHLDIITDEDEVLNYDKNKTAKSVLIDVGLKRNVFNEDTLWIEFPQWNVEKKFDYVYSIYSDRIRISL